MNNVVYFVNRGILFTKDNPIQCTNDMKREPVEIPQALLFSGSGNIYCLLNYPKIFFKSSSGVLMGEIL